MSKVRKIFTMSKVRSFFTGWRLIVTICLAVAFAVGLIWLGYSYAWTGFGPFVEPPTPPGRDFEREKTLWDWLNLLIIPIVLFGGGYLLSNAERKRDREIADRKEKLEREIAEQNTQEAAL